MRVQQGKEQQQQHPFKGAEAKGTVQADAPLDRATVKLVLPPGRYDDLGKDGDFLSANLTGPHAAEAGGWSISTAVEEAAAPEGDALGGGQEAGAGAGKVSQVASEASLTSQVSGSEGDDGGEGVLLEVYPELDAM